MFFCDTTDAPIRKIRNNEISGSNWLGMAVWGSNSFKIQYNSISDGDIGVDMFGSDGNRVKNNVLDGNNLDLSWDQTGDNVWKNNVYDTQNWP